MRTHVVLPDEILDEIDKLVGKRKRSQFLAEAALEKLKRMEFLRVLEEGAGLLKDEDTPGWETPEETSRWLAQVRGRDQDRLERVWGNE